MREGNDIDDIALSQQFELPTDVLVRELEDSDLSNDFIRSFPLIYARLAMATNPFTFTDRSAWERRVIHTLADKLGLETVSVNSNAVLVQGEWSNGLEPVFGGWDDLTDHSEHAALAPSFQECVSRFPHILVGVSSLNNGDTVQFSKDLTQDERLAVHCIAERMGLSHDTMISAQEEKVVIIRNRSSNPNHMKKRPSRPPSIHVGMLCEQLRRVYALGVVVDMDGQYWRLRAHVDFSTGILLQHLASRSNVHRSLEVGLACGVSTLHICQAFHEEGTVEDVHTAIDPFQHSQWHSIGIRNVESAGYSRYLLHIEEPSEVALPKLLAQESTYQLVFIDGNHMFDHAFIDIFYSVRMLDVGGFLILDDADMPAISKLVNFVQKNWVHLRIVEEYTFDRTVTFRKDHNADSRLWFSHIDF